MNFNALLGFLSGAYLAVTILSWHYAGWKRGLFWLPWTAKYVFGTWLIWRSFRR